MSGFLLFSAVLLALALVQLLPPFLKTDRFAGVGGLAARVEGANLKILREQMAQLDAEFAAGRIDEQQYLRERAEIAARAIEGDHANGPAASAGGSKSAPQHPRRGAWFIGVGVPVLAISMYAALGNPGALSSDHASSVGDTSAQQMEGVTAEQVEAMVARLARRLEDLPASAPQDAAAWEMLARSYAALQRFAEADRAYVRAVALAPGNAQLLADRADVLAMLQNRSAEGEPARLIARALELDPANLKALALAGSAAFEKGAFAAAADYWTRALRIAPAGSQFALGLTRSLEEARAAALPGPRETTPIPAGISGVVRLATSLEAKVAPDDTVFIFARATNGTRMPLAVLRRKVSELPITFTLDDSAAMSPETRLSRFRHVVVAARVSRSGNAMAQSGDLVGETGPVQTGAAPVALTIDTVQP